MDLCHLARLRLHAQGLAAGSAADDPVAAVSALTAVQSQEFVTARWSVGQRCGASLADVAAELDAGTLLRTHVLRPTWHYVTAADVRWLQDLTAPRVAVQVGSFMRKLGLGRGEHDRFAQALTAALAGGRVATRDELEAVAVDAGLPADRMQLAHLLMQAELDNVLTSGPLLRDAANAAGRHHTYALLSDRAPEGRPAGCGGRAAPGSPEEAAAELVLRYFTGHGPATVKDLAWWSSLTLSTIRAVLAGSGDRLESHVVDGRTFWGPTGWTDWPATSGAWALQTYDELIVGYSDSRDVVDVAGVAELIGPGWGRGGSPVVVDGQVRAHWKATVTGGVQRIRVVPLGEFAAGERDRIVTAVAEFAEFGGQPYTVDVVSLGDGA